MNQNTGQRNQALMYNLDAGQRNFNNQMTKAGPTMGAQKDMAGMYGQQAQGKRDLWSGVGQSVGQGAGAYGQHQQYQEFLDRKYPQE